MVIKKATITNLVVLNAIEILTATENQLSSMLGRSTAIAMVHSYLTDTLETAGSAAVSEEGDFTAANQTTPSRKTNTVEIVAKTIKVSRTQSQIQHYHGQNELERQTAKAFKNFGNSFEFDLVRSTLVSGVSGTAPKMEGVIAHVSKSTNTTAHTSGTVFNLTILDGMLQNQWKNSNGSVAATDLLVSAGIKRRLDDSVQKSNVVINAPNGMTEIVHMTSTVKTSFGTLNILPHRYVFVSGTDSTDRILGVNRNKGAVAWLKMPYIDNDLARSGDYDIKAVVGKATFECQNADGFFFANGFLIE